MKTLAIDPAKWAFYYSVMEEANLVDCGCIRAPSRKDFSEGLSYMVSRFPAPSDIELVLVEYPQHYEEKHLRDQDIIDLGIAAGATIATVPWNPRAQWKLIKPSEWKGQVPKDIHNQRILKALTPTEANLFRARVKDIRQSLHHNVIDAIGINLKWHKRIA